MSYTFLFILLFLNQGLFLIMFKKLEKKHKKELLELEDDIMYIIRTESKRKNHY